MRKLVCIMSFSIVTGFANAGVVTNSSSNGDEKKDATQNHELRCWQYGKLIFAESGWSATNLSNDKALVAFAGSANAQEKLYLIDMQNATCLYRGTR